MAKIEECEPADSLRENYAAASIAPLLVRPLLRVLYWIIGSAQ